MNINDDEELDEILDGDEDLPEDPPENDAEGEGDDSEPELSEIEQVAAEMGWSPQDKWRGPEEQWVDAKTFLKRGPEILKQTLSRQDQKLSQVSETMERMARVAETAQERAYERARADILAEQEEAVAAGDLETFRDTQKQLESLDKEKPTPTPKADDTAGNPDEDPAFKAWHAENSWYGPDGDPEKTLYAEQTLAPVLSRKYKGAEFYEKIAEGVARKFDDTRASKPRRAPNVAGGGSSRMGGNGGGQSYNSLPAEAKKACDDFIKQGLFESREEYVKNYFAQEA